MNCTNCNRELQPGVKFCPYCGTPVEQQVEQQEQGKETTATPEQPHFAEEENTTAQKITKEVPTPEKSKQKEGDTPPTPSPIMEERAAQDTTEEEAPATEATTAVEETEQVKAVAESLERYEAPVSQRRPASQETLDSIDLAVAQDMEQKETVFEDPPLYIPQPKRSKAPIVITFVLTAAILIAAFLFATGIFQLPSFSSQSPMVLTNGKSYVSYGMPKNTIEEELGAPISTQGEQSIYEENISVLYRDGKAVRIALKGDTPKRWRTSERISIGATRSDIFSAYGTDNLVSVMEYLGRLDDPAKISKMEDYLVPYQYHDGTLTQINSVNPDNYEANPESYYWVAIHVGEDGKVDYISIGDSIGVFENA